MGLSGKKELESAPGASHVTSVAAESGIPNIPAEWQELWEQLKAFQFDEEGAEYAYSHRLSRYNSWSYDFALRVIEEYRKFLFLLKAAGHIVSPSKIVDQAWHLHLIYTHSYWEVLCLRIFKQPMHHYPGNGSSQDQKKFAAIYERTLEDYAKFFGKPPEDIWGKPNPGIDWRSILADLPVGRKVRSSLFELFPRPWDEGDAPQ